MISNAHVDQIAETLAETRVNVFVGTALCFPEFCEAMTAAMLRRGKCYVVGWAADRLHYESLPAWAANICKLGETQQVAVMTHRWDVLQALSESECKCNFLVSRVVMKDGEPVLEATIDHFQLGRMIARNMEMR